MAHLAAFTIHDVEMEALKLEGPAEEAVRELGRRVQQEDERSVIRDDGKVSAVEVWSEVLDSGDDGQGLQVRDDVASFGRT